MKEMELLGVRITPGTKDQYHHTISEIINRGVKGFVLSANVYSINLASNTPWLSRFYRTADIVWVDGGGIVVGFRILGDRIPPRLTMADWGWEAASYCAEKGHTLFLLGSPDGVAQIAAKKLTSHAPDLQIVGMHHGFFSKNGIENEAVIRKINEVCPDILMVGMGMPLEQRWILDNYRKITAKVFWEVGAGLQYWAGLIPRCPMWMQPVHMEWLYRLILEPRRMAKRYLFGNTVFMLRILSERLNMRNSTHRS